MATTELSWLYETSPNDRARYVLGVPGSRPLVCFGINPSTARPGHIDGTVRCVERAAERLGYDGWVMLNVYPQRATNPNDLHKRLNRTYHQDNLQQIESILSQPSVTLWAAWGTLIEKRKYLLPCLQDIYQLTQRTVSDWVSIGAVTKQGHPHHPLYLPNSATPEPFDMERYLVLGREL
ncbi:MAG: DUF1643 domain-containing protein [Bacteroidota bacterium]